jgi:hypothetical protein
MALHCVSMRLPAVPLAFSHFGGCRQSLVPPLLLLTTAGEHSNEAVRSVSTDLSADTESTVRIRIRSGLPHWTAPPPLLLLNSLYRSAIVRTGFSGDLIGGSSLIWKYHHQARMQIRDALQLRVQHSTLIRKSTAPPSLEQVLSII